MSENANASAARDLWGDGRVLMAPSILSADFMRLSEDVARVAPTADLIHVDVMDGHFTPNLTIGPAFVRGLRRDFPQSKLDVHLMVSNPDESVDWYLDAGADLVTMHYEALAHANRAVAHIHERGALAGIALNPSTPVQAVRELVEVADLILVMSVNPGFGGQRFIPSTIRKIQELVALCEELEAHPLIEVDGGINVDTAPQVVAAGARILVAGSAVFEHGAQSQQAMEAIRTSAGVGLGR